MGAIGYSISVQVSQLGDCGVPCMFKYSGEADVCMWADFLEMKLAI